MMIATGANQAGGVRFRIDDAEVQWTGEGLSVSGDAVLTTALLPSLVTDGNTLSIDLGVSPGLAERAEVLHDIFTRWIPTAHRRSLHVTEQLADRGGSGTGVFFSGGVDSFHATLKHREELDKIIFVEGFDIPDSKPRLRAQARQSVERAAEVLDLDLIVLRTDVRKWSDGALTWDFYHGAALATAAHLMWQLLDRVIIPSTYAYEELFPWGSHPLTDRLWSGAVDVVHSGSEQDRTGKIATIADNPVARSTLRVCWKNPDQAYNCGRCEKCLRTMTSLEVLGVLGAFTTFPDTLSKRNVERVHIRGESARKFAEGSIRSLEDQAKRPDLQRAWAKALAGPPLHRRLLSRARHTLESRWPRT